MSFIPTYNFEAQFDEIDLTICAQEVIGLDLDTETIKYTHGNHLEFSNIKMPNLKIDDILIKVGIIKGTSIFDWYSGVFMNTNPRSNISIRLLNENKEEITKWMLTNAFVKKINSPNLNEDSKELYFEIIQIAHEGITVTT